VFATSTEHDEYVLSEIEKLNKRDILFILGDFLFDGAHYDAHMERLRKAKCRIKLVMGNHDSTKLYKEPRFEMQLPFFTFKNMVGG
jgi:calcineurin-like phosphoesterase family protein